MVVIEIKPVRNVTFGGVGEFSPTARGPAFREVAKMPTPFTVAGALLAYVTEGHPVNISAVSGAKYVLEVANALRSFGINRIIATMVSLDGRYYVPKPRVLACLNENTLGIVCRCTDAVTVVSTVNGSYSKYCTVHGLSLGKRYCAVDAEYVSTDVLTELIRSRGWCVIRGNRREALLSPDEITVEESRVMVALKKPEKVSGEVGSLHSRRFIRYKGASIAVEVEMSSTKQLPKLVALRFGGEAQPATVTCRDTSPFTDLRRVWSEASESLRDVSKLVLYFVTPSVVYYEAESDTPEKRPTLEDIIKWLKTHLGCDITCVNYSESVIGRYNTLTNTIERYVVIDQGTCFLLKCNSVKEVIEKCGGVGSLNPIEEFLPDLYNGAFSRLGFGTYVIVPCGVS